ncbi:unnamed protein product, partial [Ectocarpus sp. 6 AP-2014]
YSTSQVCESLCANYTYFGTQYGTECWCDEGTADYAQNGPGVCYFECAGSTDNEFCGGFDAMSIRQHEVDINPDYLGCFSDPADSRIFELVASSDDMTVEVCLGHCSTYEYYGTQYSAECWCGDETAGYDANGASDECVMPCAGDVTEICGGPYSMSVYQGYVDRGYTAYRGCYSDTVTNRVFVQNASSDEMTIGLCATQCPDSAFYGTQYSSEACASLCTGSAYYGTQYSQEVRLLDMRVQRV